MKSKQQDLHAAAIKSTRIVVVLYVIIKQLLCMLDPDIAPVFWVHRGVTCAVMLALGFIITGVKISKRSMCILVTVSLAIPEIIWVAAVQKGEWILYFFLIGCSLMCMLYLDNIGLVISMTAAAAVLAFCSFGLGITMTGPGCTMWDDTFAFACLVLIDVLIYFICKYSVGAFSRFMSTGQTFDRILETTPNYMVVIDKNAHVVYISGALAQWLGLSHSDYALNRPLLDLCRTGEMYVMFQELMECEENIEKNYELTIDDTRHWFMLRSSLIGGDSRARIIELADITPIMEAKNEAEAATLAKSSFLANMSHEIRTPMNAIVGMTELLMTRPLEPGQLEQASAIKSASMSLLNIINDILDFSKIDAEKMEIICAPFDIMSLINDTVNIINIKAAETGIAFTAHISKNLPAEVYCDEIRIKQALINILNNAVKFTKEGCVSLRVECECAGDGKLKLSFSVSDTGVGIKKEDIGKLFGAFSQLDTRKNRNIVGTGLGLAITRRLIELMGGAISVESTYGKGSVFSFYVICKDLHSNPIASLPDPEGYSVLCFEPNVYHAGALRAMLEDLGASCHMCCSLSEFEEKLRMPTYTHVLFDKAALVAAESAAEANTNIRFTLIKDIQDTGTAKSLCSVNRPVLITSLANVLKGNPVSELENKRASDIKLGSFGTRDVHALLVDDNPVNLMVADGMLRQYGIEVVTAPSGQEGIAKLQSGDFDIVLMDHMMPGMDGIDATLAIRALGGRYASVPIIALTANAISGMEQTFLSAGMNGFISKPIVIKQLNSVLLEHLPAEKVSLEDGGGNKAKLARAKDNDIKLEYSTTKLL